MPGIYYLLAMLLRGYDVAGSADAMIQAAFAARFVMWLFAGAVLVATFALGTVYRNRSVGWSGAALLSLSVVFVARTLEIRPDVPGLGCWVASQLMLFVALTRARTDARARRLWLGAGGLLLGATLVFTQKALLAGPGFAVFTLIYLLSHDDESSIQKRLVDVVVLAAGCIAPVLLVVAHFWMNGAVGFLLQGALTNNLGWIQEVTAASTIRWMLLRDPFLCAFAAAGFGQAWMTFVRDRETRLARAVLLLPTTSLIVGLWAIPTPFPQYLLLVLPAAAVYGADFLWTMVTSRRADETTRRRASEFAVLGAVFATVAAIGLSIARPFFRNAAIYPAVGVAIVATAIVLARRRQPALAAAAIIVGVSTYSLQQLVWMKALSNADALAQMRFIHGATTDSDRVMDGFSGFAWFRPHAAFYWFTAPGVRPRIPASEKVRMVAMLATCGHQPKAVILDDHLRQLAPDVEPTVARYYSPTAYPLIWLHDSAANRCLGQSPEVSDPERKSLPNR